jgi:nucleoside-diphosphate-sugar epimerase
MRYLVTGGTGFIGSALVKSLLTSGHNVTVFDRMSRGKLSRLKIEQETAAGSMIIQQGDIRDAWSVQQAARGCDAVIHLAYVQGTQTFYSSPVEVLDVATRGMLNVLDACEHYDIRDLMVVSSSEAYQVASIVPTPETIPLTVPDVLNPRFSYGGGKILHELMANAWAAEDKLDRAIIVRPHNIYGPDMGNDHVIPEFCIRMNKLVQEYPDGVIDFPIQGSGLETRSFCYISDCIDQLRLILGDGIGTGAPDGASVWHVGTMDEHRIEEVAYMVADCYGRIINLVPGKLPQGSPPRRLPDTAKVGALGYKPEVSFADGLRETVSWYQKHA